MQINGDACIRNWTHEPTSRESHILHTVTRWTSTNDTFQRVCGSLWPYKDGAPKPTRWWRLSQRVGSWDRRRSWGRIFMRHKVFLKELSLSTHSIYYLQIAGKFMPETDEMHLWNVQKRFQKKSNWHMHTSFRLRKLLRYPRSWFH